MPIAYTVQPAFGSIATSDISFVSFDIKGSTATFVVVHYDAGGNILTTETITVVGVPAATMTAVKTAAYNKLIALRGAGTVT